MFSPITDKIDQDDETKTTLLASLSLQSGDARNVHWLMFY